MADVAFHPEKKDASRSCFIETDTERAIKDVGPPPSPFLGLGEYVQFEGYPGFRRSAETYENAIYRYRIQRLLPMLDKAKNLQFKSDAAKKEIYRNLSENFDFEKSEIDKSRKYTQATVYEYQPCMDSSCLIHPEHEDSNVAAEEVMRSLSSEDVRFMCSEMNRKIDIDRYPSYKASVKHYNETLKGRSTDDRWKTSYFWMSPAARQKFNWEHGIPDSVEDPMQKYEHLKGYISDLIVKYSFVFDSKNVASTQSSVVNTAQGQVKSNLNKSFDGDGTRQVTFGHSRPDIKQQPLTAYHALPFQISGIYGLRPLQQGSVYGQGSVKADKGTTGFNDPSIIGPDLNLPVFTTNPWSFWKIPIPGTRNVHSFDTGKPLPNGELPGDIRSKLNPGCSLLRSGMYPNQSTDMQRPAAGVNTTYLASDHTATCDVLNNYMYNSPTSSRGISNVKGLGTPNGCNDSLYWLAESQCYEHSGSEPESPSVTMDTRGYSPQSPLNQYRRSQNSRGRGQDCNASPLVTYDFNNKVDRVSCRESDRGYSPSPSMHSYLSGTSPGRDSHLYRNIRSQSRSTSLSSRSSYSHRGRHSPHSSRRQSHSRERNRTQRSRDREVRVVGRSYISRNEGRRPRSITGSRSITRSRSPTKLLYRRDYRKRGPRTRYSDNDRDEYFIRSEASQRSSVDRYRDKSVSYRDKFLVNESRRILRSRSKDFNRSPTRDRNKLCGNTFNGGRQARNYSENNRRRCDGESRDSNTRERDTRDFSSLSVYRRKICRS